MKIRTTAVIAAAVILTLGACKKQNETNANEEATPAATPAPAESAATMTPATMTPADTTMSPAMNMGADTGKMKMEKKGKK